MEDDDDDFYGNGAANAEHMNAEEQVDETTFKDEAMQDDDERDNTMNDRQEGVEEGEDESEDEDVDEDDDDDVLFTLEKPEGAHTEPVRPILRTESSAQGQTSGITNSASKEAQAINRESRQQSIPVPTTGVVTRSVLTLDGKEGKDFPEIHSSKIDLSADPIWQSNGKLITDLDIDADLAEHSKPWRITGTDQTDYFNYGFDEYTWTMYCLKQREMRGLIDEQKASEQQMKAALGIGDKVSSMPALPAGAGMGGMPEMFNPEQMMQQMMAQGINPANMDFNQFMQMAGQMGGPGIPGPTPGHSGGFGSGQNSASPAPGLGQGFQPPSSSVNQQGMQGAVSIEGYSPQQLAIMQEQQGMPTGGGRGRGRRGRGYY